MQNTHVIFALTVVALVSAFFGGFGLFGGSPVKTSDTATSTARVTQVIDGDTVRVQIADSELVDGVSTSTLVRLIGIDAPEIDWDNDTAECFARQSRTYLQDRIKDEQVLLTADPRQPYHDDYGRLLAYITVDGTNINKQLLQKGYATQMAVGSGYTKREGFLAAQASAQSSDRGVWAQCQ